MCKLLNRQKNLERKRKELVHFKLILVNSAKKHLPLYLRRKTGKGIYNRLILISDYNAPSVTKHIKEMKN